MYGLLHLLYLSGSIKPSDDHTGAYGDPIKKTDQKENQASGGTDGGQGFASQKISHDKRIGRIIKLLKKIA